MFDCDIIDANKRNKFRKADICFVLAILAISFTCFVIMRLRSTQGSYAIISYDDAQPISISFEQPEDRYFLITYGEPTTEEYNSDTDKDFMREFSIGEGSTEGVSVKEFSVKEWEGVRITAAEYNVFVCINQEISMLQSSCPDKICVHHSAISKTGENIICLPHKLVIEIKGIRENDIDGVAY